MKLLVATSNLGKLREIEKLLGDDVELCSLADFPHYQSPEETGATLRENAEIKALTAAKATGMTVLAEDSGLEVDALHGEPGVRSARYAGENASDRDNNQKLLQALDKATGRTARYRCIAVVAKEGGIMASAEGTCEGEIAKEPKGSGGFGYDPIFLPQGFQQTMAELSPETKNKLSHRGEAIRKLKSALKKL